MRAIVLMLPVLFLLGMAIWWALPKGNLEPQNVTIAYATPAAMPQGSLKVYHLGHSLVGRDIPAMLAQLAGSDHRYDSQLGWGTSLREHWYPDVPIAGFETENAHPHFRPATEAIGSGEYDAVILTEMVDLRAAIRYHKSAKYLSKWAELARQSSADTQVFLYETWPRLDDPQGWLPRVNADLSALWEKKVLLPDLKNAPNRPIYVIPAGQVMARLIEQVDARGGIPGLSTREDLFSRTETGEIDPIHLSDIGNYLVALTHYAVLYQRSPVGLPYELLRADGTSANAVPANTAHLMQETVWSTVTSYPKTGIPQ
ncbi:hypothetical protein DS909_02565 [Phaeobacter gallaeciensis]|uniref:SGNH/GDSL hydrolase family protein n=2 Tax=Roseobacteraceae TaxID=2854170 RepID=A0A366X8N4_9RHOB|nr:MULTISPECIES: hypothetical protein [Roseobacteraceae]MBT3142627.1 hypothetical protein [Falsiruegeria litorea]MBT8168151.1 hypothetical protein [Falsiruegeria litorea]RBW61611.1 hypothetical protein DS909_02565 [Phaeobacter gallaeciensis]